MRCHFAPAFLHLSTRVVLKNTAGQPYDVLSIAFSNAYKLSFSQVLLKLEWSLISLVGCLVDFKLLFLVTECHGSNILRWQFDWHFAEPKLAYVILYSNEAWSETSNLSWSDCSFRYRIAELIPEFTEPSLFLHSSLVLQEMMRKPITWHSTVWVFFCCISSLPISTLVKNTYLAKLMVWYDTYFHKIGILFSRNINR